MTLVLLFLAGALCGALAEQVWHVVHDRPVGRPASPAGTPGVRRWRPRRIALVGLATLAVLGLAGALVGYAYARSEFDKIEKVAVGDLLAGSPGGTNYLMVGTDNRPGVEGNRSDTMLVLRVTGSGSTMMSIPRDLYVSIPGRDGQHRINTAYNSDLGGGPATVVRTVQETLGIPIDRYVEINFVSFAGLVDALGGVVIDFPHPATDAGSGLDVRQTGAVRLDGAQALAYVRARHYTETIDGQPVTDPTGDLGRVKRQQAFLRAVLAEAGASRNPFTMARIGRSMRNGLKVDDAMTVWDGVRFAWGMGRLDPVQVELPTTPTTTDGGASVLLLRQPEADPVLARFRG